MQLTMSTFKRSLLPAMVLTGAVLLIPSRAAEPAFPDPKVLSFTPPDKIQWRKSAASDTANLVGDPNKEGLYVILIKWHPHNMSRPHTHNTARYVTVVSGTWWIGTGPHWDPNNTYPAPAGSYVVDLPGQVHWDGAKDEDCVLEIVGMGPVSTDRVPEK